MCIAIRISLQSKSAKILIDLTLFCSREHSMHHMKMGNHGGRLGGSSTMLADQGYPGAYYYPQIL